MNDEAQSGEPLGKEENYGVYGMMWLRTEISVERLVENQTCYFWAIKIFNRWEWKHLFKIIRMNLVAVYLTGDTCQMFNSRIVSCRVFCQLLNIHHFHFINSKG